MGRCGCSRPIQPWYKAGGIALSRTTYKQVKEGKVVGLDGLVAGDLLFTECSVHRPERVGIYIGHGLILQAPRTDAIVNISRLAVC
ncbi:NlpC/P60 family protein [Streptomyces ochraceiscleroticus]|uniref:NlpC/P60 family protein n=1 Tax=Streptomyces ochraceiscleroticus TaxID=47761 RepID=A0ABW1MTE7_9ACTN|nr:NlpC/P60 family protein [Streptomyces ochraceiscleroticus]